MAILLLYIVSGIGLMIVCTINRGKLTPIVQMTNDFDTYQVFPNCINKLIKLQAIQVLLPYKNRWYGGYIQRVNTIVNIITDEGTYFQCR